MHLVHQVVAWVSLLHNVHRKSRGIAIAGVFAYAESLKVEVMFHQFGLDEKAGGIGA